MKHLMKNSLFFVAMMIVISSCSKEEFAVNKGTQSGSVDKLASTSTKLCAQSTLISPQVDILMLWDNSSSFNFVTPETKASMSDLIASVSENFDYHILTTPLVPANSAQLYESQLIVKNNTGLTGTAASIVKSKEAAISGLGFSQGYGSAEAGIDRATQVIEANRSNGIFRKGAYTIIVVISNEDDKGCSLSGNVCNNTYDYDAYLAPRINKLLCLRGNTSANCSSTGYSNSNSLDSAMMRFINISPLTKCASGNNQTNYLYRKVAKSLYEANYTNGWPTSNDSLDPFTPYGSSISYPDSYNLCSLSFSHIFDGVNTAIKQTLLKHKYDYWPVAAASATFDPDTIRVVRSDGKILANRRASNDPDIANGYELLLDNNGLPQTVTVNTRFYPTAGEPFYGKVIRLYGQPGNDKVVYPDCLTITFDGVKSTYGYVYLQYGEPKDDTIQVYRSVNGGPETLIPKSSSDGWDYMGLQNVAALDSELKIINMNPGATSGYFIRLNGSYKFKNSTTTTTAIKVYYNSKNQ